MPHREIIMSLNGYQNAALKTQSDDTDIAVLALGLAGESGEVCDHVKKFLGHGHPLDSQRVGKELGDLLWYVAVVAEHLGFTLEQVANDNIEKLHLRYPEGFSSERSLNRDPSHD